MEGRPFWTFVGLAGIFCVLLFSGTQLYDQALAEGISHQVPPGAEYFRFGLSGEDMPVGGRAFIQGKHSPAEAAELLSARTSPQWRAPSYSLPRASLVCFSGKNRLLELSRCQTEVETKHELPVIALVTRPEGLIDQKRGILVQGLEILNPDSLVNQRYMRYGKWWQYPGNYHNRGKEWQRDAYLTVLAGADKLGVEPGFTSQVGVRVNGNNTRGFPDKALRVYSKKPLAGYSRFLLRAAGNDYEDMLLRDAFQHELCKELGFDVMNAQAVVLYINGVYWGIKYLRPRIDQKEIARRYKMDADDVTILVDMARLYKGKGPEVRKFWNLVKAAEELAGRESELIALVDSQIELDNFFQYMSAQMILANHDWPFQNLKFWKYTGHVDSSNSAGKWRFIMGDSDLAFGFAGEHMVKTDMYNHVLNGRGPVSRIFKAMMSSQQLRSRFFEVMSNQLHTSLSSESMLESLERFKSQIASEIPAHISRWRRPVSVDAWNTALEQGRDFASSRASVVLDQIEQHRN